jgi:hypothetical protein
MITQEDLQKQTYVWGRVYAVVAKAYPDQDTPERIDKCSISPLVEAGAYIRLAKINQALDEATDIRLAELLENITTDYPTGAIPNELQGSFWLGYYHERGK